MHVLVVNFRLNGVTEEQYAGLCDEIAPAFAEVPGLASKTWLADSENGIYGGVYLFEDRDAFEAFASSDLAAGVKNHPNLADVTMEDFGVLESPSRVTHGLVGATA
jgi:hypothetical protein